MVYNSAWFGFGSLLVLLDIFDGADASKCMARLCICLCLPGAIKKKSMRGISPPAASPSFHFFGRWLRRSVRRKSKIRIARASYSLQDQKPCTVQAEDGEKFLKGNAKGATFKYYANVAEGRKPIYGRKKRFFIHRSAKTIHGGLFSYLRLRQY